jgi:hypothetical protein
MAILNNITLFSNTLVIKKATEYTQSDEKGSPHAIEFMNRSLLDRLLLCVNDCCFGPFFL